MSSPDPHAVSQLRWWRKLPPTNLIERGDHLRYRYALYLIVQQVTAVLLGLNNQPHQMHDPSRLTGLRLHLDELPVCPDACGSRLEQIVLTRNQEQAWRLASDVITEVLALVDPTVASPLLVPAAPLFHPRSPDALTALAHGIAQRYQALPGIDAVTVSGSLARGTADRMSDIDLSVYCITYPPEQERLSLLTGAPGVLDPLVEHACDTAWIDGTLVHVRYWLSGDVERMITAFPKPPEDFLLAEDLQCCLSLYDPAGRLQQWKACVRSFSSPLIASIVDVTQQRRPILARLWNDAWSRRDLLYLYGLMNQAANDWLVVLFVLNHRFLSTPRWSHRELQSFSIIPRTGETRLCRIVDAMDRDVEDRWIRLEALWEELIDCGIGISDFGLKRA